MLKGYLENEGISKVILKADIAIYFGRADGVPMVSPPQIIFVPENQVEKTKELLKNLDEKA